jgi:hypothetical protein
LQAKRIVGKFKSARVSQRTYPSSNVSMAQPKNKQESRLQELIVSARNLNIQVRTEKLLREAGYRPKSGSCRVKGQNLILIDRDARVSDQIEFLASELAELKSDGKDGTEPATTTPES